MATTKVICIGYCEGQNEPSIPIRKVFELPTNKKARDKMLKAIFIEHVAPCSETELSISDTNSYGDIMVSTKYGVYLFVTLIED